MKEPELGSASLFHRLDRGRSYRRAGIGVVEADQNLISGVLQPGVGLMQLTSRFARQLAELIAIGHMRECPENQIRTHYGISP